MDHGHGFIPGQQLLIDTAGAAARIHRCARSSRWRVAAELRDEVFGVDVTRIDLGAPTEQAHDLAQTHLAGNLLPAVQGERIRQTFRVPDDVVVRAGAGSSVGGPRLAFSTRSSRTRSRGSRRRPPSPPPRWRRLRA